MKGKFISIWDGEITISTPAELIEETGEVITDSVDVDGLDCLNREYFDDGNDNEHDICPCCHSFILTTVIKEGVGKVLYEVFVCSDPECENQ